MTNLHLPAQSSSKMTTAAMSRHIEGIGARENETANSTSTQDMRSISIYIARNSSEKGTVFETTESAPRYTYKGLVSSSQPSPRSSLKPRPSDASTAAKGTIGVSKRVRFAYKPTVQEYEKGLPFIQDNRAEFYKMVTGYAVPIDLYKSQYWGSQPSPRSSLKPRPSDTSTAAKGTIGVSKRVRFAYKPTVQEYEKGLPFIQDNRAEFYKMVTGYAVPIDLYKSQYWGSLPS